MRRKAAAAPTLQATRGSHQCCGITVEDPAGIFGDPREQWKRWPLALQYVGGLQDARAQAGIAGGRGHPRTHDHLI